MNYLETGALYFSNIKTDEVVLINFHTKNSVPVSFFEKLKKAEIEQLTAKFDELCNTNLHVHNWLGKLVIVSMHYLTTKTDMIVVNASGLANDSILYLTENLSIVANALNKLVIVNDPHDI